MQIKWKNKNCLDQSIDRLTIKNVHVIMERLKFITYILDEIFVWPLDDK